ncbi:unnamed protein product [Darwinula stevensoni]|uniref:Uncharacterized protein n=1 Tax=Darwinula stevensoni TaxID=69355 RepID=A0A7R9A115_9CRUS|nr:unnamed protein product [Darwinula stevensoni]CAG0886769.1 unnamed protein product [Darwinula stevensoni]
MLATAHIAPYLATLPHVGNASGNAKFTAGSTFEELRRPAPTTFSDTEVRPRPVCRPRPTWSLLLGQSGAVGRACVIPTLVPKVGPFRKCGIPPKLTQHGCAAWGLPPFDVSREASRSALRIFKKRMSIGVPGSIRMKSGVDSKVSCHVCRPTDQKDMDDRTRAQQINITISEVFGPGAPIPECSAITDFSSNAGQMSCPLKDAVCVMERNRDWTARYCEEKFAEDDLDCDYNKGVIKCTCAGNYCNLASLSRISSFLLPFASLSWMATRFLDA